MYDNIVAQATETIDYLGLTDKSALANLPSGALADDGIAVDGPYEIDEDGLPQTSAKLVVFPNNAILRVN
jgi:hypothetical protein